MSRPVIPLGFVAAILFHSRTHTPHACTLNTRTYSSTSVGARRRSSFLFPSPAASAGLFRTVHGPHRSVPATPPQTRTDANVCHPASAIYTADTVTAVLTCRRKLRGARQDVDVDGTPRQTFARSGLHRQWSVEGWELVGACVVWCRLHTDGGAFWLS